MSIPAGKVAAGNPAKTIKDVSQQLRDNIQAGIVQYREMNRLYRQTMKEIPL